MSISIVNSIPANYETPRVSSLIPDQLVVDAKNFILLFEEYYKYLNTTGLPSNDLNRLQEEHDIDEVTDEFINELQSYIAAYVPTSKVIDRKSLYKKIVKYYYSSRGSTESAVVFFNIFFGEVVRVISLPDSDVSLIQNWLNYPTMSSRSGQQAVQSWLPYSYEILTGLPNTEWENSYRALVHPIGFKYFVIAMFVLFTSNQWNILNNLSTINPWNYSDLSFSWFRPGVNGATHSPTFQPSFITGDYFRILTFTILSQGRMDGARYDYQLFLKFFDLTPIQAYANYVISDAIAPYAWSQYLNTNPSYPLNGYAEFSNIAMIVAIEPVIPQAQTVELGTPTFY